METAELGYTIRKEIADKLAYLQLAGSLMKEMAFDNNVKKTKSLLVSIHELINKSSDEEIISKGPTVLNLIEPLLQAAIKQFPPRKSISEIADAYNQYCRENPGDITEYGIYYGWLIELLDCKKLYRESIPAHSKVGTFHHAGKFIIEESVILRDAFFFLLKAEIELHKLEMLVKELKDKNQQFTSADRDRLYVYNSNVGTYCRTSLLMFYSFIEAYVNGIGLDHLWTHSSQLTENEKETLKGLYGKNYLSLEKKLEKFHMIIRPDRKQQFITTDKNQLQEPFITFLKDCKEIRNSSVHYSPLKARIIRKPHEWYVKVIEYSKTTLEVAKVFWDACYVDKKYPNYLDILDYEILKGIAQQRIDEKAN